jgi:ribosome-binding protein aMBF1 (putative translation factor)
VEKYQNYKILRKKLLKDKATKKAYDELGPEFELVTMIIKKRLQEGLTQTQLANKIGTKQPVISRLEQGSYNPTIKFLRRIAKALDAKVTVSLR